MLINKQFLILFERRRRSLFCICLFFCANVNLHIFHSNEAVQATASNRTVKPTLENLISILEIRRGKNGQ